MCASEKERESGSQICAPNVASPRGPGALRSRLWFLFRAACPHDEGLIQILHTNYSKLRKEVPNTPLLAPIFGDRARHCPRKR